jgi:restriction endonuclease S subunit
MKEVWEIKRLGEVAEVFDGPHATPKTVDSGPIFLGISSLQDGVINLGETRHLTAEDFQAWTRRVLPQPDDVVFSYETRLGQAAIIPEGLQCCLGRRMGLVRINKEAINPRFFLFQYLSPQYREFLDSKTVRGATVDRISIKEFPFFPVAVPPLLEQQRIVALLDEAFAGLATAKANAERNFQSAHAIFESRLRSIFDQRGPGWVEKPFEACIEDVKYTTKIQRKEFLEEGSLPIVSQEAETINGFWNNEADAFRLSRPVVIFGDHTQILKYIDFDFVLGADGVKILLPKSFLIPKFFFYALRSVPLNSLGYARHYRLLKELEIGFPDPSAQAAIVHALEALEAATTHLAQIYERKLAALEELKKSLLHQAFNGDL